jgi:hypothetical protein
VRRERTCRPQPVSVSLLALIEAAKVHPWIRRNRVARRIGLLSMKALQGAGVQTWGTKSFEFWTFLSAALWLVKPRSIVELGSGRSTQYLADYAMKAEVPFVSAEQSRAWVRRIQRALTLGLVSGRFVHHVPIGSHHWYDVGRLDSLVCFPCDCLVIDGPVGAQEGLGQATRDGSAAREWLSRAAVRSRLIIVDDAHREENLQLFHLVSERAGGLEMRFLAYQPGRGAANVAAFGIEPALAARLDGASLAIGIAATRQPTRA